MNIATLFPYLVKCLFGCWSQHFDSIFFGMDDPINNLLDSRGGEGTLCKWKKSREGTNTQDKQDQLRNKTIQTSMPPSLYA